MDERSLNAYLRHYVQLLLSGILVQSGSDCFGWVSGDIWKKVYSVDGFCGSREQGA